MFTGSMVGTGAVTFAVWSYVIANMEPGDDGRMWVELNPSLLAGILGEPLDEVAVVVEKFCQPDEHSRSKEEGGRKLVRQGQFLYWVVNGAQYRLARNKEARREYQRKWMAERRAGLAAMGVPPKKRKSNPLPGEGAAVAAEARGDQNGADAITTGALPEVKERPSKAEVPQADPDFSPEDLE